MKKILIFILVLSMAAAFTGCGNKDAKAPLSDAEGGAAENREADMKSTESLGEPNDESLVEGAGTEDVEVSGGLDNFSADGESVKAFAKKIKECVADKNLEGLADLVSYPTYVGFPEDGKIIESKEDFLALDKDKLFTEEMIESIAETDIGKLEASMAGFTMCKDFNEHTPSMNFSLVNGELGITGINY